MFIEFGSEFLAFFVRFGAVEMDSFVVKERFVAVVIAAVIVVGG